MSNIWTIAVKELRAYFASPIAYIVLAAFSLNFGWFFSLGTAYFVEAAPQAMGQPGAPPMNVNQWIIQPSLGNFTILFLLTASLITMRLYAEESRQGTIELLLTSPLKDYEIIVGKWFGALLLYLCMLAIVIIVLSLLFIYSTPDWKPVAISLLGLVLMGGTLLSLGAFISTLTKSQIVAAFLSFIAFFMLYVIGWIELVTDGVIADVIGYLSIQSHSEQFNRGVVAIDDVIYYVSGIALGWFLCKRSLESMRWRA